MKAASDFDIMSPTIWPTAKVESLEPWEVQCRHDKRDAPIRVRLSFASAYVPTASEVQRETRPLLLHYQRGEQRGSMKLLMLRMRCAIVRCNAKWMDKARSTIQMLDLSATAMLSTFPDVCPEVLNTPNMDESTDIVYACLVYGVLAHNRDVGRGKFNVFCQLAEEHRPATSKLMNEIDKNVYGSQKTADIVEQMRKKGIPLAKILCMCVADWGVTKLTKDKLDFEGRKQGVHFLGNQMLQNVTSIK